MFPSGRWSGYWEQAVFGRQAMTEFSLRFADDGSVAGEGRDLIGRFTFAGTWTRDGVVVLVKQYVGKHRVRYVGRHAGEGLIAGRWDIGEAWTGPFALHPVGATADPSAPIRDILPEDDGIA